MCYEERYYSEWARRTAKKREATQPAAERQPPETKPAPPTQEPEKVKERQLEEV
jgi:hypothetical protein